MSRGGHRIGAGRPGWHAKTAGKLAIDVRRLHRDGHLAGSNRITWTWSSGSAIELETTPDIVTLVYNYKDPHGEWRAVRQPVTVTRTLCHYGGSRPWFVCPRCHGRVAILYLWNAPACRKCARLVYPSQADDATGRSWRRTRKLEKLLSGGTGEWNYRRPKSMRQATFERLREAYWREEQLRDEMLAPFLARMLGAD